MRAGCRILGHDYYWLDYDHQCHCRRCGKRNDRYFARHAALRAIHAEAIRIQWDETDQPHPDTMIGRR